MKSIKEMAADYYAKGLWNETQINELVKASKLTQKQANEIIGNHKEDKE